MDSDYPFTILDDCGWQLWAKNCCGCVIWLIAFVSGRSYMDTQQIITELEAERDRLEQAISALKGSMQGRRPAGGRGRRGRRHLSAAAKRRISEMMKKRWAERKKAMKAA
jgi:exonuclease VII small subunit